MEHWIKNWLEDQRKQGIRGYEIKNPKRGIRNLLTSENWIKKTV